MAAVIDLTFEESPPPPRPPQPGPSTSATSTAAGQAAVSTATSREGSSAASSNAGPLVTSTVAPLRSRRLPHPNASSRTAPIDLTDDDIEFIGEHRLQWPERPHAVGNDQNSGLMARLRDLANGGGLPFSRHAPRQPVASTSSNNNNNNNLRVIEQDPIRSGSVSSAGPGPAAVAAANARARRAGAAVSTSAGGSGANSRDGSIDPLRGLNARRARQRAAANARAGRAADPDYVDYEDGLPGAYDPGDYYYRRPAPAPAPAPRQARGGRNNRGGGNGAGGGGRAGAANFYGIGDMLLGNYARMPYDYEVEGEGEWLDQLAGPGGWRGLADGARAAARGDFRELFGLLGGRGGHGFINAAPANNYPPRRKVKAYSVKQSHPHYNKKKDGKDGFERDIIPPPEIEEPAEEHTTAPVLPAEPAKEEEKASTLQLQPVSNVRDEPQMSDDGDESVRRSSRNKGKGRAVDIDTIASSSVNIASDQVKKQEAADEDVPAMDLDHASPTAASSASSTFSLAKASASTRATSTEAPANAEADDKVAALQATAAAVPAPPPALKTRIIRAPVCASCNGGLYLNQPTKNRPCILICGHVVCRSCVDSAAQRYQRWVAEEAELIDGEQQRGTGDKGKGKGANTNDMPGAWKGSRVKETFEEVDTSTAASSRNASVAASDRKGKKRARTQDLQDDLPAGSHASTSTGAKRPRLGAASTTARNARRGAAVPDYREEEDDVAAGAGDDGNYVPRTAREESDEPEGRRKASMAAAKGKGRAKPEGDENAATRPRKWKTKEELDEEEEIALGLVIPIPQPEAEDIKPEATQANNKQTKDASANNADKSKGKGKGKKVKEEKKPLVDHDWLTCPIRDCRGGTDLSHPMGSKTGAWEMFV